MMSELRFSIGPRGLPGALLVFSGCAREPALLTVKLEPADVSAYVKAEAVATLEVVNDGEQPLLLNRLTFEEVPSLVEGPQYFASELVQGVELLGGERRSVALRFVPLLPGQSEARLSILSSGGSTTLVLSGTGLNAPPEIQLLGSLPSPFCSGVQTSLTLEVSDVEDDSRLSALEVVIHSDLEGELFRGAPDDLGEVAAVITLTAPGEHTLTFGVTDTLGENAALPIAVSVDAEDIDLNGVPDCAS